MILDFMMPVLDGFQTLHALRETPDNKHFPLIMLAAKREDEDVLRDWMTGVDLYPTKPFAIDDLLTAAKGILTVTAQDV